jgi:autotransporter-associated beta strand protein
VLQPDRKTVLLSTASPLAQGVTYTLTVNNVVSLRGLPVLPGSQKTFSYVPTPGNTGNILREWWTGIGGSVITDLTSNANYPNNPTGSDYRTIFEAPTDWNDSYGTRMRGYVTAPATGNYYFWIASDDASQLFLSTGTDPANKAMIAYVAGWTGSRAWDTVSTQKSAAIALVAGQTYYIEALQKEGGGGDNLAVGWQLPDATLERPIPANRLTPVIIAPDKTVSIALTDPDAAETGHNKGTFTITRTGNLASAVTVYYTVTGSASTLDFQEDLVQSVQMAAGAASVTIDVTPADDAVYEGNETVKLTLIADKAYSIGAGSAVLTIVDNDPVPPHTMTWKGGANGNWEDANAWTNSPPAWPTVTMDAVVDTASTVNVGADEFARSLSLSNGAGISLAAGKTLTVSATVSLAGVSSLTGGTVVAGAFNLQQGTVSAKLSGPGKLTKTTAGTLVLSGVSDYTGGTLISSGTVTIQNANAFTPGTQLTIGGGARIVLVVGLINTGASMASAVDSAALAAESPLSTMGLLPVESAPVVECDTAQLVRPMFDVPALGAIPGVKWPAISSQRALAHDAAIRALSDLETQSGARFQRARHVGNVPHGLDPMAWLSFLEWPRRGRRPGELRASAAELVDLQSAK